MDLILDHITIAIMPTGEKVRTSLLGQKNLFNIQFSDNIHHGVIVKVEDWELEQRKLQGEPVNDVSMHWVEKPGSGTR